MIASLKGEILHKSPEAVIVDVNGVGYHVSIPLSTFYKLPSKNEKVCLFTCTHLRQDAIQLFGFLTADEKALFEMLITVSGVGPKLAVTILSGITIEEFQSGILSKDIVRLNKIPGVGRKTAERLIFELSEKIGKLETMGEVPQASEISALKQVKDDTLSALINLGYKKVTAEESVVKAAKNLGANITLEELIKESLKLMQ